MTKYRIDMNRNAIKSNLGIIVAIILSMITVPLGFRVATWYSGKTQDVNNVRSGSILARFWSPAVVLCCLLIITLVRII